MGRFACACVSIPERRANTHLPPDTPTSSRSQRAWIPNSAFSHTPLGNTNNQADYGWDDPGRLFSHTYAQAREHVSVYHGSRSTSPDFSKLPTKLGRPSELGRVSTTQPDGANHDPCDPHVVTSWGMACWHDGPKSKRLSSRWTSLSKTSLSNVQKGARVDDSKESGLPVDCARSASLRDQSHRSRSSVAYLPYFFETTVLS